MTTIKLGNVKNFISSARNEDLWLEEGLKFETPFVLSEEVGDLLGLDKDNLSFSENKLNSGMKLSKKIAREIVKYKKLGCSCIENDSFDDAFEVTECVNCMYVNLLTQWLHNLEKHCFSKKGTLVITNEPNMLRQVSDNKGWTSCYRKDGSYRYSLQYCLWNYDAVAFFVDEERNFENWNVRILLRRNPINSKYFLEGKVYSDNSINNDLFREKVIEKLKKEDFFSEENYVDDTFFGYSDLGLTKNVKLKNSIRLDTDTIDTNIFEVIKLFKENKIKFIIDPKTYMIGDSEIESFEKLNSIGCWYVFVEKKNELKAWGLLFGERRKAKNKRKRHYNFKRRIAI